MKRGRTALTRGQHLFRAKHRLGISRQRYRELCKTAKRPVLAGHLDAMMRKLAPMMGARKILDRINRLAFGRGPNPKVSVLLVPELRKRRSERDPVLLAQQIKSHRERLSLILRGQDVSTAC